MINGFPAELMRSAPMRAVPDIAAVPPPPELEPEYGMTVLSGNPAAARFALFMMSVPGQAILARHGLVPIAMPTGESRP